MPLPQTKLRTGHCTVFSGNVLVLILVHKWEACTKINVDTH